MLEEKILEMQTNINSIEPLLAPYRMTSELLENQSGKIINLINNSPYAKQTLSKDEKD